MKIGDIVKVKNAPSPVNRYVIEKLMTINGQHRAFVSSTVYLNFASMTQLNVRVDDLKLITGDN